VKQRVIGCLILFGVAMAVAKPSLSNAEQFRIAIMQDQAGAAEKFEPVLKYLSKKGINATFVPAQDYPAAAGMFAVGAVDAMFSGSGVAGFMILKNLAKPAVRPVDKNGHSTYWAVVIAKKGAPKYTGSAKYFSGKRVAFTSLASSGDFYFHSLSGAEEVNASELNVASHGAAIELINKGLADVAIVKNRVWDTLKDNYPNLTMVGGDEGENPDNTLIISKNVPAVLAAKVSDVLLDVKDDNSIEAEAVRKSLGIEGFIKTTPEDFDHTLSLLKKADVTNRLNVAL
jgi:ABC-type phosphate/phosphonate transport system substrate-binding protein